MENPIVIVSAARTPMGHYGGYFKEMPAPELGLQLLKRWLSVLVCNPRKLMKLSWAVFYPPAKVKLRRGKPHSKRVFP